MNDDRAPWPTPAEDWGTLHDPDDIILDEEMKIRRLRALCRHLALEDARRCLEAQIGLAGFIMTLCVVDFLGTLNSGTESTPEGFKGFVRGYLGQYEGDRLFETRNRLLHNFLPGKDGYQFMLGEEFRHLHLQAIEGDSRPMIVVEILWQDVDAAAESFFQDARARSGVRYNLVRRYDAIQRYHGAPGGIRMIPLARLIGD